MTVIHDMVVCFAVISLFLIAYCLLIYPLIIFFAGRLKGSRPTTFNPFSAASVSVLIAAHNEEEVIRQRLENLCSLNGCGRMEILVGCDGCTDDTVKFVQEFQLPTDQVSEGWDITLHCFEFDRRGKCGVLNELAKVAKGEFLVFTDANTDFDPDAVVHLLQPFLGKDARCIGGTCGRLVLKNKEEGKTLKENLYWNFECQLKHWESRYYSCLGANGGVFAMRSECFAHLPENLITEDFVQGMQLFRRKMRMVYIPTAIGYESAPDSTSIEYGRRFRIGKGNGQALLYLRDLMNPFIHPQVAWMFVSHKVLRWFLLPLAFIFCFCVFSLAFQVSWFLFQLAGLITFAATCVLMISPKRRYLISLQFALFFGLLKGVTGVDSAAWKRTER
ncbi:MAG: glycosyltransferase [Verrucomicrobiota bacterium]|nr:glycosyltransferase [Verrucomicrobiota bacterium]